ncbi:MAG: hypothetical protein ACE5I5_05100 [Candidatus Heimdallarchaeota archaeon]
MFSNDHHSIEKQIEYVLELLNSHRERYKLWWNALIGLIIAIGVGICITMISGETELTVLSKKNWYLLFVLLLR